MPRARLTTGDRYRNVIDYLDAGPTIASGKFTYILLEIIACGAAVEANLTAKSCRVVEVSAVEPSTSVLGSVAFAGQVCLESGWWACSDGVDGADVLGGQRQYLMHGQRMSRALLLPPPTLWEKLKGVQPSYETKAPTSWRPVDKRSRRRIASNVALAQAVVAPGSGATTAAAGASGPHASAGTYATTGKPCPAKYMVALQGIARLDGIKWFAAGPQSVVLRERKNATHWKVPSVRIIYIMSNKVRTRANGINRLSKPTQRSPSQRHNDWSPLFLA